MNLRRWIATHWPCSAIADWVMSTRADQVIETYSDTLPSVFEAAGGSWGLFEAAPTRTELERVRDILDGKSPLPRDRR